MSQRCQCPCPFTFDCAVMTVMTAPKHTATRIQKTSVDLVTRKLERGILQDEYLEVQERHQGLTCVGPNMNTRQTRCSRQTKSA